MINFFTLAAPALSMAKTVLVSSKDYFYFGWFNVEDALQ